MLEVPLYVNFVEEKGPPSVKVLPDQDRNANQRETFIKRCNHTPTHSPGELGSTRPDGETPPKTAAPCFSRTCALAAGAAMHSRDS